jgi:hypothetical protein
MRVLRYGVFGDASRSAFEAGGGARWPVRAVLLGRQSARQGRDLQGERSYRSASISTCIGPRRSRASTSTRTARRRAVSFPQRPAGARSSKCRDEAGEVVWTSHADSFGVDVAARDDVFQNARLARGSYHERVSRVPLQPVPYIRSVRGALLSRIRRPAVRTERYHLPDRIPTRAPTRSAWKYGWRSSSAGLAATRSRAGGYVAAHNRAGPCWARRGGAARAHPSVPRGTSFSRSNGAALSVAFPGSMSAGAHSGRASITWLIGAQATGSMMGSCANMGGTRSVTCETASSSRPIDEAELLRRGRGHRVLRHGGSSSRASRGPRTGGSEGERRGRAPHYGRRSTTLLDRSCRGPPNGLVGQPV